MKPLVCFLILSFFLTLCAKPANCFDAMRGEDWSRQAAFTILEIADWLQTKEGIKYPTKYREINPFINSNPTTANIDRYFVACIVGNALITYVLPEKYRDKWQIVGISLQAYTVNNNLNLGIKIKF